MNRREETLESVELEYRKALECDAKLLEAHLLLGQLLYQRLHEAKDQGALQLTDFVMLQY